MCLPVNQGRGGDRWSAKKLIVILWRFIQLSKSDKTVLTLHRCFAVAKLEAFRTSNQALSTQLRSSLRYLRSLSPPSTGARRCSPESSRLGIKFSSSLPYWYEIPSTRDETWPSLAADIWSACDELAGDNTLATLSTTSCSRYMEMIVAPKLYYGPRGTSLLCT